MTKQFKERFLRLNVSSQGRWDCFRVHEGRTDGQGRCFIPKSWAKAVKLLLIHRGDLVIFWSQSKVFANSAATSRR